MACDNNCNTIGDGRALKVCGHADNSCACQRISESRVVKSDELFRGKRDVFILHGEQLYRLMHTRNGKLMLQK